MLLKKRFIINWALFSFLLLFCFSCKPTHFMMKLSDFQPKSNKRDALECEVYEISKRDSSFIKNLVVDTFRTYYRPLNDFQHVYLQMKKNRIDSLGYKVELAQLIKEDSLFSLNNTAPFRGHEIFDDDSLGNADIKLLIAANKAKQEVLIIVDENNNDTFSDDKIIKITPLNYKTVFDTLHFDVSNLKVKINGITQTYTQRVMINQITYRNALDKLKFSEFLEFNNPWICCSKYYTGEKSIGLNKKYFLFDCFIYNIGFPNYDQIILTKYPIKKIKNSSDETFFYGKVFKIKENTFRLDSISNKIAFISRIKKIPQNNYFKDKLKFLFNSDTDTLISVAQEKNGFQNLLRENSGNLIYIDLWASWCIPCRNEMSYLKMIRNEYAGKRIAFLYLSVDENRSDWIMASKQDSIEAYKLNYLLQKGWDADVIKKNNIASIPMYILIDKNGKLIDANAPRPSNPALRSLLDKYLKL